MIHEHPRRRRRRLFQKCNILTHCLNCHQVMSTSSCAMPRFSPSFRSSLSESAVRAIPSDTLCNPVHFALQLQSVIATQEIAHEKDAQKDAEAVQELREQNKALRLRYSSISESMQELKAYCYSMEVIHQGMKSFTPGF